MEQIIHETVVTDCPYTSCMYNRGDHCALNAQPLTEEFMLKYQSLQNGTICQVRQQINKRKAFDMLLQD